MARSTAKQVDDVLSFLRDARISAVCTEAQLERLSAQRRAAEARMVRRAPTVQHPSANGIIEELLIRDEELAAASAELEEQVTALTRACTLLERERCKYIDLFTHAPDAYVVTDLTGLGQDANLAAGALLGTEPGLLVGRPLITFIARQDTRAFRNLLREIGETQTDGPRRTLTVRLRPRGQAVFVVCAHVSVVRALSGRPLAIRWMLRASDKDETAEGRSLAEAALATILTDDLPGPLTAIRRSAELLREGGSAGSEDAERELAWIETNAAAQQRILDDLAELGDAYSDPRARAAEDVDLWRHLRATVAALPDSVIAPVRVKVEAPGPEAAAQVRVNADRLGRALDLLLRRAAAGTPQDGVLRVRGSIVRREAIVDIDPPLGAQAPAGWGVRTATAARIVESFGGRLVLSDQTAAARLLVPTATR
jgi:PAS domain S-box-containing protein